jgi:nitrogen fixation NifU-like protein
MLEALRDLYQEVILDHSRAPRNHRRPPAPDREAEGYNPLCGDMLTLYVNLDEDGRITDAAFEGKGCAVSVASASLMTEIVKGRTRQEADRLFRDFQRLCTEENFAHSSTVPADAEAFERLQALSGVRQFKCATLAWHTLHAALHKQEQDATTGRDTDGEWSARG